LIGNTFAGAATPEDAQKAKEAIQRGRLTGAKTERERFYIEAVAEYYDRFDDRPHGARIKSLAIATARSNCGCTFRSHEVENETLPSCSCGATRIALEQLAEPFSPC
jgi:hypothetical protein